MGAEIFVGLLFDDETYHLLGVMSIVFGLDSHLYLVCVVLFSLLFGLRNDAPHEMYLRVDMGEKSFANEMNL